ncbi:MAG: cobalamin biosynthesis protein CbiX [Bacteroidia bacterium]|nr:cobalamin biosynthesis protein CbiX [Bacteroidia bacterium]
MSKKIIFNLQKLFLLFLSVVALQACNSNAENKNNVADENVPQKIGVLLVNHGSRSETWRKALTDFEDKVKDRILAGGEIKGTKTAHMEYTEPSIATRLKEFDAEGYTDVIIVPVFLTVSPHTFDDIPTIIGQKEDAQSKEALKIEKIERYTPKAKTYITPNLDFTDILKKNVLRRVNALSKEPSKEGIVLIGYGDETYDKEWGQLFDDVAEYVKENTGINKHSYGWCGHIVRYNSDKTTEAINTVLKEKEKAIVIPVLVAHDEEFQIRIIGGGVDKVKDSKQRVSYKPDAILPDENVEQWVIDITSEYIKKVKKQTAL